MSTTTNGAVACADCSCCYAYKVLGVCADCAASVELYCRDCVDLIDPLPVAPDPDPLYVPEDERDVTTTEFHFGLAILLVFVVVIAWIVTKGV